MRVGIYLLSTVKITVISMSNRDVKYRERREDSVPKQVSIRLD